MYTMTPSVENLKFWAGEEGENCLGIAVQTVVLYSLFLQSVINK
jgi:hypothetical protein